MSPSATSAVRNGIQHETKSKTAAAIDFTHQAARLAQYTVKQETEQTGSTQAVEALFVTPQDAVITTANGGRLPAVPLEEAMKLNQLKDELEDRDPEENNTVEHTPREARDGTVHGARPGDVSSSEPDAPLRKAVPSSRTNPLFPPLSIYGPPTLLRNLQCYFLRATSAVLSLCFLLVIVLGAAFTSIPLMTEHIWIRMKLQNPDERRPFYKEEERRKKRRGEAEKAWKRHHQPENANKMNDDDEEDLPRDGPGYVPLEGGPDPLVCDIGYYARRVGLDCEKYDVQTEDGFIIELWHVYNPLEHQRASSAARSAQPPAIFHTKSSDARFGEAERSYADDNKRYPVLLIPGLLQSAGAYCCNDDDSLAFYLAKSGYDVWLGNNRCGFEPRHNLLHYGDPRMWAWNIRQMGVMDLPALISRVLAETGFAKLGLITHSQGTTQAFVALAKEQRPDIGAKISVFCALAPAAYAGPLIGKAYLKFMRVINTAAFRAIFGIHAFIPLMLSMHSLLPRRLYGFMGYRVFSFLFNWSDARWERALRNRMFQFAPVYVSAESMRWWLGRECFATQKCVLATREAGRLEDEEDEADDREDRRANNPEREKHASRPAEEGAEGERGRWAWYAPPFPPLALWVAGSDDLVDGRRLLRRFQRGREPHVAVVHSKLIPEYEHLDVIWAVDAIEKVGREVRDVLWMTAAGREGCTIPIGCEGVGAWEGKGRGAGEEEVEVEGEREAEGKGEGGTAEAPNGHAS